MEQIRKALKKVVYALYGVEMEADVTVAPEGTGADYATNVAMRLAKVAHKAPMVIAQEIQAKLDEGVIPTDMSFDEGTAAVASEEAAEKVSLEGFRVEVAAPGFLNFISPDEYFVEKVEEISGDVGEYLKSDISQSEYFGKTVVAEFSDPNPFKVLHVGHLYTSVVGDAISRILELMGAKVVRANFGGDVGLHVGKTLWALMRKDVSLEDLKIEDIAKCYVEGTQAYEEDEVAKAEIVTLNKELYRINAEDDHEGRLAELYWRGRELSYEYFEDFYAKIGVKFDKYYPESAVAGRGLKEVREHVGSVYEESEGAIVYHGEKLGLHTRVFINREGVPTYEAKDVGLIFTKWDDWKFDESLVVTGNEQTEYMKVVLASVAEYAPQLVERTQHLTHGLVKLPGNVKMSSRKGNFLRAVDVLDMVREMLGGEKADPKVVLAAIKYAFLKYKMGGDIVFDPQESVSTTGNSGVYLLYSAVRAKKVLQKVNAGANGGAPSTRSAGDRGSSKESPSVSPDEVSTPRDSDATFAASVKSEALSVRALSKKIVQYKEVIQEAVAEKAPNKICTYLYELAQEFSRFYENVKVAGSEREAELAKLVQAYLNVMEHGLGLLGIEIPEEM